MLYPANIETKLGFDQIRQLILGHCQSSLGESFVHRMTFMTKPELIRKYVGQAHEFRSILTGENYFPQSNYLDVTGALGNAKVEGVFLTAEELHDISISLDTIIKCLDFFEKNQEEFPLLSSLGQGVLINKVICKEIDSKIDEKSEVRNNATPELSQIRQSIISEQSKLRKQINGSLKNLINQGYAREDANITLRGGRMVVPVLAEHKRKVNGFIHDESASGQLVYIEPAAVLEVNNHLKDLEYQERREIVRILTGLTNLLRPELGDLKKAYEFLGMIDFIRAKAKFALEISAEMPMLTQKKTLNWAKARHPLLYLAHQKLHKPVIPLSIELTPENRIIVISGPNAGGKSVCLKTVGLLQYMYQCGLLIPVEEGATITVFNSVMIDIGDEQSIENDLSTYSSHLTNMKAFLKHADEDTLFLIDEFGTGTDPNFGGVIAEVILRKLNEQASYGVVNTHYGNLKQFAENTPGIVNGAMRFDVQRLEPLYQLEIGKPGSSFALEIAYKIGLPHSLINDVKDHLGEEKVNFDKMLSRIERDKQFYEDKRQEVKRREKELSKLIGNYEALKEELDKTKKLILNEAKQEANQLLVDANQQIEATIRSIKESKADKTKTKEVRKDLDEFKEKVKPAKIKVKQEPVEVLGGKIEVGNYVRIKDQPTVGEVIGIRGKDVEIRIGSLTSKVKLNRLEKISKKSYRAKNRESEYTSSGQGLNLMDKRLNFKDSIDLRGKRTEDALQQVDELIDGALLTGSRHLRVLHGKGDGILRQMIRQHLRTYPQVTNIRDEHPDQGGSGITLFELA